MKINKILLNFTHGAAENEETLPEWQVDHTIVPSLLGTNYTTTAIQAEIIEHEDRIKAGSFVGYNGEIAFNYNSMERIVNLTNTSRPLPFFAALEGIMRLEIDQIKEAELGVVGNAEL